MLGSTIPTVPHSDMRPMERYHYRQTLRRSRKPRAWMAWMACRSGAWARVTSPPSRKSGGGIAVKDITGRVAARALNPISCRAALR